MPTSYKIRGIEPADLKDRPAGVRKLYWSWVVEYGIKRKDKELSQGLDKNGEPLRPITPETRKYRRSAMTPSGKGDPAAPPLTPAYHKSRTRSLLAGRALSTHAEFYWRFDAFTGASWSEVLTHQIRQGRNVFGLSAKGTAWVKAQALRRWEAYKAGRHRDQEPSPRAEAAPVKIPAVGSFDFRHATFGMGLGQGTSTATLVPGSFSGGLTTEQWEAHFRASSRAAVPHRPAPKAPPHPTTGPGNNVLLAHVWARQARPTPPRPGAATAPKPRPKPKPSGGSSPAGRRIAAAAVDYSRKPSSPRLSRSPKASAIFDLTKAPHVPELKQALKAIDRVHNLGDVRLPIIPVIRDTTGDLGEIKIEHGKPVHLAVARHGPHPGLTLLHEVGHLLEKLVIPGHREGRRDWDSDPATAEWIQTVRHSLTVKSLGRRFDDSREAKRQGQANLYAYHLRNDELWARSYAQYVALRSGDQKFLDQARANQTKNDDGTYTELQWRDDDFTAIAAAIDHLLISLGWRKDDGKGT